MDLVTTGETVQPAQFPKALATPSNGNGKPATPTLNPLTFGDDDYE